MPSAAQTRRARCWALPSSDIPTSSSRSRQSRSPAMGWTGERGDLTTRTDGIARRDAIGNTQAMTSIPSPTRYHRWMGWHAPAMRRTVIVGSIGLIVAVVLFWFVPWGMAVVAGWDAAALAFLITVWPIIVRACG